MQGTAEFSAAIHEAGNAIVGLAPGLRVTGALIRADGTGECGYRYPDGAERKTAVFYLAGYEAEKRLDPESPDRSDQDRENARLVFIEHVNNGNEEGFLKQARARARFLVRRYWPAIESLAWLLLEKGEVTGLDCARVLQAHIAERAERSRQAWEKALSECGNEPI